MEFILKVRIIKLITDHNFNLAKENEIFTNLTKAAEENGHFKVYNHENMPDRWHANNRRRLGPIIAVANIGYAFQDQMDFAKDYEKRYKIPSECDECHLTD